jgi:malate dehydrogenase (oxaloacetate-decarboxylating)(NADP+)
MDSGVARVHIDIDEYRERLESRLGRGLEVMRGIINQARLDPKRIVLPEGEHERIIRAARRVLEEKVAFPVLLGRRDRVEATAASLGVSLDGIEVIDPSEESEARERYAEEMYRLRQRKGITLAEARERVRRPLYFGCMMVRKGDVDGLVAGEDMYYPDALRPALQTIGASNSVNRIAGLYMLVLEKELIFFADTTVNIDPDAETLAEIAVLSAGFVRWLGIEPKVAMLSFSSFGSVRRPESEKVRRAVELVRSRDSSLAIEGEMQVEMAANGKLRRATYPFTTMEGDANVYIFPDLDAANIAYKLLVRFGGAEAIGPILLGMAGPVQLLQRGSTAADIVNLTAMTVVDAQQRVK